MLMEYKRLMRYNISASFIIFLQNFNFYLRCLKLLHPTKCETFQNTVYLSKNEKLHAEFQRNFFLIKKMQRQLNVLSFDYKSLL